MKQWEEEVAAAELEGLSTQVTAAPLYLELEPWLRPQAPRSPLQMLAHWAWWELLVVLRDRHRQARLANGRAVSCKASHII